MSFTSTYRAGETHRPTWDAATATDRVRGNTSRATAIRFAHTRSLDQTAADGRRLGQSGDTVIA